MYRFPSRLHRLTLLFIPLAMILSACQTDIVFTVNKNNTYTMSATMVRTAKSDDKTACNDVAEVLNSSDGDSKQLKLERKNSGEHAVCMISFDEPQPIEKTDTPFLKIRRYGDYFTVSLDPDKTSTFRFSPDSQLRMTIRFPGNIQSVNGTTPTSIEGHSVTWTNPEVLRNGFTVNARASTGLTTWQLFWVFVGILVLVWLVFTIVVVSMRKTKLGAALWQWELGWLVPLSVAMVGAALHVMDFFYRWWKRGLLWWRGKKAARRVRSEGPAATTSSIPIVQIVNAKRPQLKRKRKVREAAAATETNHSQKASATTDPLKPITLDGKSGTDIQRSAPLFFSEPRSRIVRDSTEPDPSLDNTNQ